MARLNYPIGIQDFRELRTKGYHYLDKTAYIHQLLVEGKNYFLARPRHFGKSLLLSTIKEIYSGSRELFTGLWIENNWDWGKLHPVVHLFFSSLNYQQLGLAAALSKELVAIAQGFSIPLDNQELKDQLRELLQKLCHNHGRVVLLIDEYDKPIVDYLEVPAQARANREVLKQFYSVLKDADPYLELVCITGVSKFSKVSIFSDLNNLKDLSINERYNTLLGITQDELEAQFSDRLQEIARNRNSDYPTLIAQVKTWYNGYNWGGRDTVYNPFSLLNFLQDGQFHNYWFATGTPTFLIERLRSEGRFQWDTDEFVALLTLDHFDIDHLDLATLLFQTGYLTLVEWNLMEGWCKLDYPNQEVRACLDFHDEASVSKF